MNGLHWDVKNEILFKLDVKSLAKMRLTSRYFGSHISDDPDFKSKYYSRVGSNLLHTSTVGSNVVCYLPSLGSTSARIRETLTLSSQILGSSSGLLLLFFGSVLCVVNPLTKKFRFIGHSNSILFPEETQYRTVSGDYTMCIGFVVDQIDATTQRFKIVCVKESAVQDSNETMYQFEINVGDSWKLSKATITCHISDLDKYKKPVYVNGYLHWLRNDESIIAFNPEIEKALLIPIKFPQEPRLRTLLVPADNELTLISSTTELIKVYALRSILTNPKWVLLRQIRNKVVVEKRPIYWDVVAYDGKCLMLRENEDCLVHRYELGANKWAVMGSIPVWCDAWRQFYLFEPWHCSVMGLDEKREKKKNLNSCDTKRISTLSSIMGLIAGISSEKVEMQLRESVVGCNEPTKQ